MSKVMDKIELYIMSLWLLFLLIIIVNINIPFCYGSNCRFVGWKLLFKNNWISIISLLFLLYGILGVSRFNYRVSGSVMTPFRITTLTNKNYEHLTFLSTYVIPLIAFDLNNTRYFVVLIVLLTAVGGIYIKTNLFFSNPTLALLGFQIYEASAEFRVEEKYDITIISRNKLSIGDKVSYKKIDENIYYARKTK